MICRPKEGAVFAFYQYKCIVTLAPQQKWKCQITQKGFDISRDNVTIDLTNEEFHKYFKITDKEEKNVNQKSE